MICAGVKGWTPEVDAIEDCKESRRRGGEVDRDATELYIAVASPREAAQVAISGQRDIDKIDKIR